MCIALAFSAIKKKKDQKAQEENARVVPAGERPASPSSRVPPQVLQVPHQDGEQNGEFPGSSRQ
jgi:hypothetical protein